MVLVQLTIIPLNVNASKGTVAFTVKLAMVCLKLYKIKSASLAFKKNEHIWHIILSLTLLFKRINILFSN